MFRSLRLQVLYWWNYKPLPLILLLAVAIRLLSAIFSKGYGMHDDHFLVIEVAQKWLEGIPHWFDVGKPSLHSLFYPGFHYFLFSFLEGIGIKDPQSKMYFVRIFHALYSLITVYYGYLLALTLSGDKRTARTVGLMLATLWCLPFLSVRNLREITCIPPLLMGFYYYYKSTRSRKQKKLWFISAALFGLAFTFRYQTIFFPIGLGVVLLLKKEWKALIYLSFFYFAFVAATQGVLDWIAWGYPFASLHAYFTYNQSHANDFITAPWYNHLLTIAGYLIPPISLFFVWGFITSWRKYAELFWPVAIFLFFHSLFPNKQERFIFPLIPFFIVLGIVGWNEFIKRSVFWKRHPKILSTAWSYFWILNIAGLLVYSFTYSKRSRVEAMYYLYKQKDAKSVLLESYRGRVAFPPLYYLDKWEQPYTMNNNTSLRKHQRDVRLVGKRPPNYIVFFGDKDLTQRLEKIKKLYPKIVLQKEIEGSLVDQLLFFVNPKFQTNENAYIYKIKD